MKWLDLLALASQPAAIIRNGKTSGEVDATIKSVRDGKDILDFEIKGTRRPKSP